MDADHVLVAHCIMAQCSFLKTGMKDFKKGGEGTVSNKLSQPHLRDTFKPMHPKELDNIECKQVVESHLFLKEKRNTTAKGCRRQQTTQHN
jgi:hypothetical protein